MKHMEMRGDFLSERSEKQTEGQNPKGRKKGRVRRRERQKCFSGSNKRGKIKKEGEKRDV